MKYLLSVILAGVFIFGGYSSALASPFGDNDVTPAGFDEKLREFQIKEEIERNSPEHLELDRKVKQDMEERNALYQKMGEIGGSGEPATLSQSIKDVIAEAKNTGGERKPTLLAGVSKAQSVEDVVELANNCIYRSDGSGIYNAQEQKDHDEVLVSGSKLQTLKGSDYVKLMEKALTVDAYLAIKNNFNKRFKTKL
ncbi:MAG: hypothetical protein HQM08_16255 [Candidatus Riflebacteria bacterium]|nr:hypothetical protein [Candidatus Riflebacteria bacterium]